MAHIVNGSFVGTVLGLAEVMVVGVANFSQTRRERDHSSIAVRARELALPGEAPEVVVLNSLVCSFKYRGPG